MARYPRRAGGRTNRVVRFVDGKPVDVTFEKMNAKKPTKTTGKGTGKTASKPQSNVTSVARLKKITNEIIKQNVSNAKERAKVKKIMEQKVFGKKLTNEIKKLRKK